MHASEDMPLMRAGKESSKKHQKVKPRIQLVDLGLVIDHTLIISDMHVGYEESLNKQGMLIPRFQFKDVEKRLKAMLEHVKPHTVVINGDMKHEFGTISNQEWRETLAVLDLISKYADQVILVKGNHDTILGPIAKKRNVHIVDHFVLGDYYFCHGHVIPDNGDFKKAKTIVIGHEHPAILLRDTIRAETYKCFLFGTYKRKRLIVLPSFNLVTQGTNVTKENLLSPFLHQNLRNFDVYVVGDGIYYFGKLKNIK